MNGDSVNVVDSSSEEQATLWNGLGGATWTANQDLLERLFRPFEEPLLEFSCAMEIRSGFRLLDVGCGTGSTTRAAARKLGAAGRCMGIDISEPMIAAARACAERDESAPSFVCANAQGYPFEPGQFDAIVSRFGVMFFDDPIKAFANLLSASKAGAELRFIAWRGAAENPFMTEAERAAADLLPKLPARSANGSGQFAFADSDIVREILQRSGWTEIEIAPLDVECSMPETELDRYIASLGPVGRALQQADEETRSRVLQRVRPAFDRYFDGLDVRFTAACWMVSGRNVAG